MVYTVSGYLKRLTLAKRTARTIQLYRERLGYFANFLEVPIDELHNHLTKENLVNYAEHIQDLAPSTREDGPLDRAPVLQDQRCNGL